VLINKVLEFPGKIQAIECNTRFVRSTEYPDIVRVAALFDPPYLQVGDAKNVTFTYRVVAGFTEGHQIAPYDIAVEVEEMVFELVTPKEYKGSVRLVRIAKPTEYVIDRVSAQPYGDKILFRGTTSNVDVNTTYAIRWS
jgi:hypothetical protein